MKKNQLLRTDVRMLQAIHLANFRNAGTELGGLIATADWLDHSIPTFGEINNAVYNLKHKKLLRQKGLEVALTAKARGLFREFGKLHPLKQLQALVAILEVEDVAVDDPNRVTAPELFIDRDRYDNSVQTYLQESEKWLCL